MEGHTNRRTGAQAKKKNFVIQGWGMLHRFHRLHKDNPGRPLAVDIDFSLDMGEHTVCDSIELAREIDGEKQLVILVSKQKIPTDFEIRNDLKTTLQVYALRQILKEDEDKIILYSLETGRQLPTIRTSMDLERVQASIENICKAIQLGIWFPRQNIYCPNCYFCDMCAQWGKS